MIPSSLRTTRLCLRRWHAADATALLPVLDRNTAHLGPWIPPHVATPAPLPELAARLAGFADDFRAGRAYRYAVLARDGSRLLGEADLFPRAAAGRVPLVDADHVEIGYWLDMAVTGQGFATEAAAALLGVAQALPGMTHVEIRCDAANAPSAAVPLRLGFRLDTVASSLQVWRRDLAGGAGHAVHAAD